MVTSSGSYGDAFKGTAYYYARFRPAYPAEFFHLCKRVFNLDGRGRLLDLGCGTGQLAVPFSPFFEEVIAMDPEPEMLAEAQRIILADGITNITLTQGGSSDLSAFIDALGTFRLVAMGSSFHWMDRTATLDILSRMVEPGGGVAIASGGSMWTSPEPWCRAVKATIQKWLGSERRAGSATYSVAPERHEDIIDRSPFGPHRSYSLRYSNEWTTDGIIGYLYSTSFCSPSLLGHNLHAFEKDLRETLLSLNPTGRFIEAVTLELLVGTLG